MGTTFSGIDNLTKVLGRHTLKFGVEIRRIRLNNSGNTLTTSTLDYATNEDFINNQCGFRHLSAGRRRSGNAAHVLHGLCAG